MFKKIKIFLGILLFFVFSFNIVLASSGPIVPQGDKYDTGDYELNDFLQIGINVTNIILGVVGSLTLLMFVYGGIMMLISAGNSEKVTKARGIIVAAVIGLAIVFASYLIIQFIMSAFGVNWQGDTSPITSINTLKI